MTRRFLLPVFLFLGAALPRAAAGDDGLRVVVTIPDLADIAREIGGDRVDDLYTLAKGTMNVHSVPVRPSAVVKMNKADLFVQIGLSLEHAYVPGLLLGSRNDAIQPGAAGFVNCSVGWEPIQVPPTLDRSVSADVHPQGNPHMNLDPKSGRHMAQRILEGFLAVDPDHAEDYRARHAAYVARIARAEERWEALAVPLHGAKVVTYHRDFAYFARATGMEVVCTLEPKPGVPPTPSDLARVVETMKAEGVRVILTARWANGKAVRFAAEKTGATVLEAPVMVEGVPEAKTWIGMMDFLYERLGALVKEPEPR